VRTKSTIVVLALAIALALGASVGLVLEHPALSMFLGMIAIPIGLYAAVAAPSALVPLAVAAAVVGASVIVIWIYELAVALSKSS